MQPAQIVPSGESPQVQQAPTYNPYAQTAPSQQPIPQPQQPQQQQCNGKSEEYVKRLEWIDRCFRSCLKN